MQLIDELLEESQAEVPDERRSVARKPFAHPVKILTGRGETHDGCSKDISKNGISILTRFEWRQNTIATLTIHSLKGRDVTIKAEARWCQLFGEGWYLSGWRFVS